jgi:hypothetical protein
MLLEYLSYREHIIISLQLFKKLYIKDVELRIYFVEEGGAQLIKDFMRSGDLDMIEECLYNIEDLIYVKF